MLRNVADNKELIRGYYSKDEAQDIFDNGTRVYIYKELTEEDKLKLIEEIEFKVEKVDGDTYKVIDKTGENLGNIKEQVFANIDEIMDRLENYFNDYDMSFICE